jgi:hypothetical protein
MAPDHASLILWVKLVLALQLQLPFQVGLFSFGLVAAAPDGPSDDESGFDPALG